MIFTKERASSLYIWDSIILKVKAVLDYHVNPLPILILGKAHKQPQRFEGTTQGKAMV